MLRRCRSHCLLRFVQERLLAPRVYTMHFGRLALGGQAACLLPHAREYAQRPPVLLAGFGRRYDIKMSRVKLDIYDRRDRVPL